MSLKFINQPISVGNITHNHSLSPNTENSLHRTLYENISRMKKMIEYKSPYIGDKYKTYHSNLINKFESFNDGKCIVCHNNKSFGLDSSLKNDDFFNEDYTGYTAEEIAYLRQQKCVYLYKKNKDEIIDIPINDYDVSHISDLVAENGKFSSKVFINGIVDFKDNPINHGYDFTNLGPLFGVILDHNGDETNPSMIMLGVNPSTFKIMIYTYNKDFGFGSIGLVDGETNNFECNFGRYTKDYLNVFRNNQKSSHYGDDYNGIVQNRESTMFYQWKKDTNWELDTKNLDMQAVPMTNSNYLNPINIGLYICPEFDIRIYGFNFGIEMNGY